MSRPIRETVRRVSALIPADYPERRSFEIHRDSFLRRLPYMPPEMAHHYLNEFGGRCNCTLPAPDSSPWSDIKDAIDHGHTLLSAYLDELSAYDASDAEEDPT